MEARHLNTLDRVCCIFVAGFFLVGLLYWIELVLGYFVLARIFSIRRLLGFLPLCRMVSQDVYAMLRGGTSRCLWLRNNGATSLM